MDPALSNFDIFKRKPAGDAEQPPAPAPKTPLPKPSHTEMRNRMLVDTLAKKYDGDGAPERNGARHIVASVTVDSSARIVAIDEHCTMMFGWKGQELAGQHLKVLLRDGSDHHLASFLQPPKGNDTSTQLFSLRVIARRMDGREFPASLTRLSWTPQAPVKSKNPNLHLRDCWTAVFRELTPGAEAGASTSIVPVPIEESRSGAPSSSRLEDVPQFQGSPAALRSANEELQKKLEAMAVDAWKKGQALAKAEKERDELAREAQARDTDLKQARSQLEQELEKRKRFEAQMRQVSAGKAQQAAEQNRHQDEVVKLYEQARLAAERAEAARQQETARAEGFKQALANLQLGYDKLNARVMTDQHGGADARRRVEELESIVRGTEAEVERANAELEKRNRLEAQLQDQVRIAKAAADRAEAAYKQEVLRAERAERDLVNLRRSYDEVDAKLTAELHASAEVKRRARELETTARESAAEVERINAQLQRHNQERNRFGSEWQEQIDSATAAAERAEAAHKQEAARAARLERDLGSLRERFDEMGDKLSTEVHFSADARRRLKEFETSLRQNGAELERALAAREKLQNKYALEKEAAIKTKLQVKQLQKQVREKPGKTGKRARRRAGAQDPANLAQFKAAAERASAESRQRIDELEKRLSQSSAELAVHQTKVDKLEKRLQEWRQDKAA